MLRRGLAGVESYSETKLTFRRWNSDVHSIDGVSNPIRGVFAMDGILKQVSDTIEKQMDRPGGVLPDRDIAGRP